MATMTSFAIEVPDVLLARVRAGDRAAFEQLYRWFERPVFTLAARILGDRVRARDVLQDNMLKAYSSIDSLDARGGTPFWGSLRQVAVNEALMRLRRDRQLEQELADDGALDRARDPGPPPPAAGDASQLQRAQPLQPVASRIVRWLDHAEC